MKDKKAQFSPTMPVSDSAEETVMRRPARPGVTGGANAVSEAVRSSGLVIPRELEPVVARTIDPARSGVGGVFLHINEIWKKAIAEGWTELREHAWHGQPCGCCGKRHGVLKLTGYPPDSSGWNTEFYPATALCSLGAERLPDALAALEPSTIIPFTAPLRATA